MRRKDWDYLVIAALLLCGLYVTLTGLVADVFGLPQVAWHGTMGYVCAALAVAHVMLNWRQVTAYAQQRLRRRRRQEQSDTVRAKPALLLSRRQLLFSGLAAAGGFVLGRLIPGRQTALPYESTDVGELYHQWSKPGASQVLGAVVNWGKRPERYKTYADAERIVLPEPRGYHGLGLEEAVEARRSARSYSGETLALEQLSRLLHAAQGVTAPRRGFRAAPSAGALYPIELYAVVHDVTDVEPGIYHYAVREHALEAVKVGDFRSGVVQAGLFQSFVGQANVCFILSAVFQRTRWRYRERTYRYIMLEAGHVGQNLYLAATSMGLGACAVGAFLDDEFNDLLGLDGKEEATLYVISVGMV